MKSLSTLIFLIFVQFSFAQSLAITGDNYFASDIMTDIAHHLDLKNTSSNAINVICQKTVISVPNNLPSWGGASYCFAGNCYSASSTLPSSSAILGPGEEFKYSSNDLDAFSGYYIPAEIAGISVVEYCFYDANNPSDKTCATITYDINGTPASVADATSQKAINFLPNPAKEYTTISYNSNYKYNLKIIDILGNTSKDIYLSNSGKEDIYVGDLNKGIYFGNLIHNNRLIEIKKLIVR
tara:strand:+ start:407 stop:1123 length:717 start_codon:yes stop_codon:yes gene_type:complete